MPALTGFAENSLHIHNSLTLTTYDSEECTSVGDLVVAVFNNDSALVCSSFVPLSL